MTLRELEAQFLKWESNTSYRYVDTLAEADGICFLCPKCYEEEPRGPVGCHSCICWFVGKVPDDCHPVPGRWKPSGTTYDDLTFVGPGAASVQLLGGCNAHFFIRQGRVEDLT